MEHKSENKIFIKSLDDKTISFDEVIKIDLYELDDNNSYIQDVLLTSNILCRIPEDNALYLLQLNFEKFCKVRKPLNKGILSFNKIIISSSNIPLEQNNYNGFYILRSNDKLFFFTSFKGVVNFCNKKRIIIQKYKLNSGYKGGFEE